MGIIWGFVRPFRPWRVERWLSFFLLGSRLLLLDHRKPTKTSERMKIGARDGRAESVLEEHSEAMIYTSSTTDNVDDLRFLGSRQCRISETQCAGKLR